MTLWFVKKPVSFGDNMSVQERVGYIYTVRHARDYKVKCVVATSGFFIELCQKVVAREGFQ